jgi:ABC-type sugar transport system permease subunit
LRSASSQPVLERSAPPTGTAPLGGSRGRRAARERLVAGGFLFPALFGLGVFVLWPMVQDVAVSLRDERLTSTEAPFVGLANWRRLFDDGSLTAALELTLLYTVVTVGVSVALALCLALYLHERPWLRRIVSTAIVLPIATSLIIASVSWRLIFDVTGGLNQFLGSLGIGGLNWLNEPSPAKGVIITVGIWAQTGFALLLYQAGLARVPSSLPQAARLFGVGRGMRFKLHLIVPLLHRTTTVVIIVSTLIALRAFDQVYALTHGDPYGTTRTLAFLAWQQSFVFFNLGQGAVTATVLVGLVLLVVAIESLLLRRAGRARPVD